MNFKEIQERCWTGYQQQGMKKKGDRQVPNCVPVEEQTGDPFVDNAARELLAMVLMFGVPFVAGVYIDIRNKLNKYQGKEIIGALERKGVTMNRQTYEKVKPVLDRFDQAIRDNEGAEAKALAKQIEQMIIMGKLSAPEPKAPDSALAAKEKELAEDLKKWFKEKWVRFGPDGKIRGDCARGSESEGKPKCLPQSKAHALGKKGRASAAAKKRREDPNPERRGPAKNVATKVNELSPATLQSYADKRGAQVAAMKANNPDAMPGSPEWNKIAVPAQQVGRAKQKIARQQRQQGVAEGNNDDWDDADEFGMPGSEFFPDDDRLRDGDYVRDRQDGEYGEIFRMSGDPSERRVRILDRDGKGWYISPERLVAVDRNDPDIMKYFGKRRQRDMDEGAVSDALSNYLQVTGENDVEAVKAAIQKIARDPGLRPQSKARLLGQVGTMINKHRLPIGREYYQYMQKFMEAIATESRGGNYEQLGLRKSTADRYAVLDRTLDSVIMTTNDLAAAKQEAIEWADYDDIKTEIVDQVTGKRIFAVNGNAGAMKYLDEKQDACYRKVKSRYKVWPSAYASGALVQCRKKGAANWGNKSKK